MPRAQVIAPTRRRWDDDEYRRGFLIDKHDRTGQNTTEKESQATSSKPEASGTTNTFMYTTLKSIHTHTYTHTTLRSIRLRSVLCMYGHKYSKSMDPPGKVANPACGQLNRENDYFPVRVRA